MGSLLIGGLYALTHYLYSQRASSRKAMLEDALNLLIPVKGLDLFNINEGLVGAAG